MNLKDPLKIALVNSLVKLIPAEFLISRLARAAADIRPILFPETAHGVSLCAQAIDTFWYLAELSPNLI